MVFAFSSKALSQNWQKSFTIAKDISAKKNKTLALVFSGSDWCAPCMKLENEIWNSEAFKTYSKEHFVLYKADFPRKKKNKLSEEQAKQNAELAEKYNSKGFFPLVVLIENEKVLGETGYKKLTPNEYINHLNSFLN